MPDPWLFDSPGAVPGIAGGMFNPSDIGGLLADPEELKRLIAQIRPLMEQFQPNEADRRDANTQAIITAGLSMLGTRKGQEWDRLGYAGLNALDAKGASLAGASKAKRDQLGDAQMAMGMLEKLRAQQEERKAGDVLANFYAQRSPAPTAPPMPSPGSVGGGMGPTVAPGNPPRWEGQGQVTPQILAYMQAEGGAPPELGGPGDRSPAPLPVPAPVAAPAPPSMYDRLMQLSKAFAEAKMPKQAMKYEEEALKHQPKYDKTPRSGTDAQGNPITYLVDEQGGLKVLPVGPELANAHWVDTGVAWLPLHPKTGTPMGAPVPKSATPGEMLTDERAKEAARVAAANAKDRKPPEGYFWGGDDRTSLVPIPGGPKDTSVKQAQQAADISTKADLVIGKVDEAIKQAGWWTTGGIGALRGMVPGSSAYDLRATVDTIKSNLSFDTLQKMRDASPSGGALGSISEKELTLLGATIASIDANQDKPQLIRNLQKVKEHYTNWDNAVRQSRGLPPRPPTVDSLESEMKRRGLAP